MTAAPPPAPHPPPSAPRKQAFRGYGVETMILVVVLVFAVAVVVPTWLLGGFAQLPKEKLPKVSAGTTVKYGEFRIKVVGAKLLDKNPLSSYDTKKGHSYLSTQVTVENLTKETAYTFKDLLLLGRPVFTRPAKAEDIMRVRDGGVGGALMPRVPETEELIWEVPDAEADRISDTVPMTLQRRHWQEGFFSERMEWKVPTPWYSVDVPVVREGA